MQNSFFYSRSPHFIRPIGTCRQNKPSIIHTEWIASESHHNHICNRVVCAARVLFSSLSIARSFIPFCRWCCFVLSLMESAVWARENDKGKLLSARCVGVSTIYDYNLKLSLSKSDSNFSLICFLPINDEREGKKQVEAQQAISHCLLWITPTG